MNAPADRAIGVPQLRAVLVDDTPDVRLLLRAALEGSGRFTVVGEAGDGATGIEAVTRAQPDVVLLDLAMPVLDGLEALPRIRGAAPGARVIVLSGFESSVMRRRAHAAGAHAYLQKGINPYDVVDQVLRLIGSPPPATPLRLARPLDGEDSAPAAELLAAAPFGVLLVRPRQGGDIEICDVEVCWANRAAVELLGASAALPGAALSSACPPLAAAVADHRTPLAQGLRAEVDVRWLGRALRATLAATSWADAERGGIALYLAPATEGADDAAWLRSAVAGAAHEIRNPTVVIAGAAAALSRTGGHLPDHVRHDLLGAVARQARLLDQATGDLLTAAQAHRGTLRVDPRPVALATVLATATTDAPPALGLTVECPPGLAAVADPLRVQQMVLNLLGNAAKYGAAPVLVRARADGDLVRVDVVDAGPGVPADFVPALFGEFSRAPGTAATGTGLGLFVVRSLAEAHGGTAWYEPGPPGPAFVFTLPRTADLGAGAGDAE